MRIEKIDWYFDLCKTISKRSTCIRKQVGAIIVREGKILTTGYNGPSSGENHCIDIGYCQRPKEEWDGVNYVNCKAIHAEQNAILQAAKFGITIKGANLYCTIEPCEICKKLIKGSGLRGYYYIDSEGEVKEKTYIYNIME